MKQPEINYERKTIEITKAFSKKAKVYNSEEYKELVDACQKFPTYVLTIVENKRSNRNNKESYKGLTIDFMEKYIESHSTNKDEDLKALRQMTGRVNEGELENKKNYPDIKKWFLAKFDELRVERENLNKAIPA